MHQDVQAMIKETIKVEKKAVDQIVALAITELKICGYDNFDLIMTLASDIVNPDELFFSKKERKRQKDLALSAIFILFDNFVVAGSMDESWTEFSPWNLSAEASVERVAEALNRLDVKPDVSEKIVWLRLKDDLIQGGIEN